MAKFQTWRRIPGKTFLIFFVVFVIIILPVNVIIYYRVKAIVLEADLKVLQAEAAGLLERVNMESGTIPLPSADVYMRIASGQPYFVQEYFMSTGFPSVDEGLLLLPFVEYDTMMIVTVRKPLSSANNELMLSLAKSSRGLYERLRDLRTYLIVANVVSILIAGSLVFVVTSFTMRPIRRIIGVAKRINASKSIERVPVPPTADENRELAETINAMLSRIEQSIRSQTNFFASATHELKTPLTVMQTELLVALNDHDNRTPADRQGRDDPKVREILQSNLDEVMRLDRIIQDFLLISQLKSESLVLRTKDADLREVLYSGMRRSKYLTRERSISFNMQTSDQPLIVHGDFDKLETVLANIIENAVKFAVVNSQIAITLQRSEDRILLTCSNLIDKPVADVESLTDEFKKSDNMTPGIGMGLWICARILELHHASIRLSQQPGFFTAEVSFPATEVSSLRSQV